MGEGDGIGMEVSVRRAMGSPLVAWQDSEKVITNKMMNPIRLCVFVMDRLQKNVNGVQSSEETSGQANYNTPED